MTERTKTKKLNIKILTKLYRNGISYDYIKKAPALQTFEYLYDFAKCVIEREGEMVGSQFFLQIYMDLLERGEIPAWSVWISCGN